MGKSIYVGNLSFHSTEDSVRNLFEQYGAVQSVKVITDQETGRSRGFGLWKWTAMPRKTPFAR